MILNASTSTYIVLTLYFTLESVDSPMMKVKYMINIRSSSTVNGQTAMN